MRIENLFSGAQYKFRLDDIHSGDVVPFPNQRYLMDPENFHFEKIDAQEDKVSKQKIKKFFDEKKLDISVDDFIALWNFQVWVQMTYPDRDKYKKLRGNALYKILGYGVDRPIPLSVAFDKKVVMCTEMSALAQMYLQHKGIQSVLYFGNAFTNPNQDIQDGGTSHAWLRVVLNGKKYFYDPANPIFTKGMLLPAIMGYQSDISQSDKDDFEKIIHKPVEQGGGFAYIEAKDIYGTGRVWLYGFEEGGNRRRTESGVKRQVPDQQDPQLIYWQGSHGY